MKPLPFAFLAFIGLAGPALSQDSNPQEPAPVEETPARILGTIPDGTPPPPEAPKPEFIVPAKDILETTVVEQGGRTITLQEIKPIDLPPPPSEVASVSHESDPTFQARLAAIPVIPDFPDGAATFAFIGQAPADADLLVIQSLHDLYNKNHDQLLTAYQGRERARVEREAYLKAHPPQPKDITLNYWRIGGGTSALTNGGAR